MIACPLNVTSWRTPERPRLRLLLCGTGWLMIGEVGIAGSTVVTAAVNALRGGGALTMGLLHIPTMPVRSCPASFLCFLS